MKVEVFIVGDKEVQAELKGWPSSLHASVVQEVTKLGIDLHAEVVDYKLSGQVLNRVTGRLAQAQNWKVADLGFGAEATVGFSEREQEVPYGRWHEYGVPKYWIIEAKRAKALRFELNGEVVFRKRVTHPPLPERSFLRSALSDFAPEVWPRLEAAARRSLP